MRALVLLSLTLGVVLGKPQHVRIIGGQEAKPHSIPYQVQLSIHGTSGDQYFCSGTILSEHYVLTTALCVHEADYLFITAGADKTNPPDLDSVTVYSSKWTIHPRFNITNLGNNIAIVDLDSGLTFSDNIQAVKLPSNSDFENTYEGVNGRISGWGTTTPSDDTISPVLNYVDVEVISLSDCEKVYGTLDQDRLCTNNIGTICTGDSGGPLINNSDGKQIGIVSFGSRGCTSAPNGFTKVSSYLHFIQSYSDVIIN